MPYNNPFWRKHFWYQAACLEFQEFQRQFEELAQAEINSIPRARDLIRAQAFYARPVDRNNVQCRFGSHPTGRYCYDENSNKKYIAENGASLMYSLGATGAVAVLLHPASSDLMKANERFILRHIGPLSAYQLRRRLRRDLKDLVAYNYTTALDGDPTFGEMLRIRWLRVISLIEVKGEQFVPINKAVFGSVGFLAKTSVLALLRPWGIIIALVVAAYFGWDLATFVTNAFMLKAHG